MIKALLKYFRLTKKNDLQRKKRVNEMAKTILAVDDSGSLRQMVTFSLKSAGYDVVQAVDGQDGLDKAKQKTVDLVLTDQNMPIMDGLTLIKNLRSLGSYQNVPILMLTTESSDEMKAKGKAAGANGWLVKPFDPKRLIEVVQKVIG
jgi:two-component system chemotaxis response regulator CheY